MKVTFKWGYLSFLLVPLVYLAILKLGMHDPKADTATHYYFSARTTKDIKLSVLNGKDTILNQHLPPAVIKFIDFRVPANNTKAVRLVFSGLAKTDTLSLYSFNLYEKKQSYSLDYNAFTGIQQQQDFHAGIIDQHLILLPQNENDLSFLVSSKMMWKNYAASGSNYLYVLVLFIIIALFIVLRGISERHLAAIVTACIILMMVIKSLETDMTAHLKVKIDKKIKNVEIYFNNAPEFLVQKRLFNKGDQDEYLTQLNVRKNSFLRFDLPPETDFVKRVAITIKCGLLTKTIRLEKLPPSALLLNDLEMAGDRYVTRGDDPYWILCSAPLIREIDDFLFFRNHLFLFLPCLVLILLIASGDFLKLPGLAHKMTAYSFLSLIFILIILRPFNSNKLLMEMENRIAVQAPHFDIKKADNFFPCLNLFLNDQVPGRTNIIAFHNYVEYSTFGVVAYNNNVVHFGKDKWMFYTGENVREMYQNANPLTDEQLRKIKFVLEQRRDWLKSQGIKYYIVFPPMSHFIYEEYIGKGLYRINKKPKMQQMMEYLNQHSNLPIIDVRTPIVKAKQEYERPLYYKTDSHWNLFGSYFAYKAIMDYIRKDFPNIPPPIPLNEIRWKMSENSDADLAKLVSLEGYITRDEYLPEHPWVNSATYAAPPEYPEYMSPHAMILNLAKDTSLPKMLMNRDSYCNYLMPYMSGHFSRSLYLWTPIFYPSIVEKEKPDIVITEMLERFIYDLLVENPKITEK